MTIRNLLATSLRFTRGFLSTSSDKKMDVIPLEALDDNYMYLIVDDTTRECAAVDPVQPQKIIDYTKKAGLKITQILTTHHHWDHADGNPKLLELLGNPKLPVYGGDDRIPALSHKVKHNDKLKIGASLDVTCLFTPCHTTGHICYFINSNDDAPPVKMPPVVLTGDTLFIAGCGRFFEGNAEQMYNNLMNILAKLPQNTQVYCGHEYTVNNLKFSLSVEPDNIDAQNKLKWAEKQRHNGLRTIPSTIGDELTFNPFMRVDQKTVQEYCNETDPILVMQALRKKKDNWKAPPPK